jgi:hypothetical protein
MDNMSGTSGVMERTPKRMKTTEPAAIVSVDSFKQIRFTLTMHGTEQVIDLREYVRSSDNTWVATDRGFHVPAGKFGKVGAATRKTERVLKSFGLLDPDGGNGFRKKDYRRG